MVEVRDLIRWMYSEHPEIITAYKESDHNHGDLVNPYHLEGDCWTHLCMVMMKARDLGVSDTVKYSALFHDLGKPDCRWVNPKKGWVSFTGHEGVSFWKSIGLLQKLGVQGDQLVRCLQIISFHTELYKIAGSEKSDLNNGIISPRFYSMFKYNKDLVRDLVQHTLCDGMGRFSDQVTEVENFGEIMEFFIDQLEDRQDYQEPWKTNTITVMIGLPCSGKSTYVDGIRTDEVVISRDQLVENYATENNLTYNEAFFETGKGLDRMLNEELNTAFKNSSNIIVDKTHMSPVSRRRSLSRAPSKYKKRAVVMITSWEISRSRELERRSAGKTIPEEVFYKMMKSFQIPLYDEFDEIEYIITE